VAAFPGRVMQYNAEMTHPTGSSPLEPTRPSGAGTDTTKWWWIIGGIFAGALVIGGLIVLLTSGSDDDSVTVPANPPTSSTTSTSAPTTTTTAPVTPGQPTIGSFTASPSPVTCAGGSVSLNLRWSTQHATTVTIETDGAPQTAPPYPPTGNTTVPFSCAANQHNYQLVATGTDNQQARQILTVQATAPPTSPPTAPPTTATTKPPATTTTKPPATTTTTGPPDTTTTTGPPDTTTTTTNPVQTPVAVTIDDEGDESDPMTLVVTPTSTEAGAIEFTVTNSGAQPHSFLVLQTDLAYDELPIDPDTNKVIIDDEVVKVAKIPKFAKGKTKQITVNLAAGNYVLIDNLPGNYALGAREAFIVTVAPPEA